MQRGGARPDKPTVDEAKGVCFELVRGVEKPRDLELFIRIFILREVLAPEDAIPFLAAAMNTYCPEMEQFRPDRTA